MAIVDTGDGSVATFADRLTGLGFTVTTIPLNSGYDTFVEFDAVLLPVGHADCCWDQLNGLADDYHSYVYNGGCLWVGQSNPYSRTTAVLTWAPYDVEVYYLYDTTDPCDRTIVMDHCATRGLSGSDLPAPFDTVLSMGAEWQVLVRGGIHDDPSLLYAEYGCGNVIVEFGNPSFSSFCTYSDAGLFQMMSCCLTARPSPVEGQHWGTLKALFR